MSLECQVNEVSNLRTENVLPWKSFFLILSHTLYQVTELDILWRDLCYESRDKMSKYM